MPANRPTATELLSAVQDFLHEEVSPKLEGRDSYHLRVALNVLAIVIRELDSGPGLDESERRRLRTLLGTNRALEEMNSRLAERIRSRTITYRDASLMDHLLATIRGKMSIDNPKYASYLQVENKSPQS